MEDDESAVAERKGKERKTGGKREGFRRRGGGGVCSPAQRKP
jgi:hypothetical protein